MKICAAAKILDTRVNFDRSGRYNQPVQNGRDAAHKSRVAWAGLPLGVYMSERQHIYEDLNESSSARPEGSQQLEIPPSPNSKRTSNFSANILARRRDFHYRTPIFLPGAYILYTRLDFHETPRFQASVIILSIRPNFKHPPEFSWDAKISGICQYFHRTPIFMYLLIF